MANSKRNPKTPGLGPIIGLVLIFGGLIFAGGYLIGRDGRAAPQRLRQLLRSTGAMEAESPDAASGVVSADNIRCYFSPDGGCTAAIVSALDAARISAHVQAYSFTSKPIAQALVQAYRRGVKVVAVLDKSQRTARYSEADFLAHAGIPTWIDAKHAIAHNKIMLIDGQTLITGSFNFTKAAERSNAENLLVISKIPNIYAAYETNFQKHLKHSDIYPGR